MTKADPKKMTRLAEAGGISRRKFIEYMAAYGVTAPLASQLLLSHGIAVAQTTANYPPTKAGGGGTLKILYWQAPTLLNPHFATGTKDQDTSRIFYEPLAGWNAQGELVPQLAAEIPTRDNGGLSADGREVTWKLKPGVKWHDGMPFTADDVIFTWEYAADPATAAYTTATYSGVKVVKLDDLTVKIVFKEPTPFWATAFVGVSGQILPKHHFAEYKGATSRDAPANLKPVGTGPYKIIEFWPGDIITAERFTDYHVSNQPHFDRLEVKGGGDSVSAARTVLQTGEFDYAANIQVEDEILKRMETGGRGRAIFMPSGNIELLFLNTTDPWTTFEGETSSIKTKHPTLSDPKVRAAINLLIDRDSQFGKQFGMSGEVGY